jgi:hypothetical protein
MQSIGQTMVHFTGSSTVHVKALDLIAPAKCARVCTGTCIIVLALRLQYAMRYQDCNSCRWNSLSRVVLYLRQP